MKMKRELLLILAGTLLATQTVRAGEPSVIKKVGARKSIAANAKSRADSPRLFRETIVMAQAIEHPPAPGVDTGPSALPPSPTPVEAAPIAMDSTPIPMDSSPPSVPMSGDMVQLYDCVKYEDLDNVHPCAVTKVVAVADPCQDPCDCCGPRCVYVQICVPPCGCPEIKTSHGGRHVKYDYGKYEVEIKSKKGGVVEVDYDKGLFNHH